MDGVLFAWMGQNQKMENAHPPLHLVEELLWFLDLHSFLMFYAFRMYYNRKVNILKLL
jgi:hypothetical protein